MLLLRKFDYYGQYTIGIIMLLSIHVLFLYGFAAGIFIVGCWQLFSASFNTVSFLHAGMGNQIGTYWKWTGIIIALLFLCYPLSLVFDPDDVQVIAGIAVTVAIPVAWYYLHIYTRLITHLSLRHELGGILKS